MEGWSDPEDVVDMIDAKVFFDFTEGTTPEQ